MKIIAQQVNKKFRQEYIIRDFSFQINANDKIALIGQNGSGKSTLLKILAQYSFPTKGSIEYFDHQDHQITKDQAFQFVSFVAPYVEVIEEFTLTELVHFLQKVKYLSDDITLSKFEDYIQLSPSKDKLIKNFSSGMRQKVKLGAAMLSSKPLLFLDEPTSNLDQTAKKWFSQNILSMDNKIIVMASNETSEIDLCESIIHIQNYK
jgi:ABC-type multidrug transport system ATPase subunit